MSWADGAPFERVFAFRGITPGPASLEVEPESALRIDALAAHEAPDAIARAFAGGVILANPAGHAVAFDLGRLYPGSRLRRLRGGQDPVVNDGRSVGTVLTVPALDAAFLSRE